MAFVCDSLAYYSNKLNELLSHVRTLALLPLEAKLVFLHVTIIGKQFFGLVQI